MTKPERAPLLFESDYFVFAVRADDGTERVYQIIVNRGGTASLSLISTNSRLLRLERVFPKGVPSGE